MADGVPTRERMKIFAQQFFLQVVEFPRAVSALHTACPFPEERRALAESALRYIHDNLTEKHFLQVVDETIQEVLSARR